MYSSNHLLLLWGAVANLRFNAVAALETEVVDTPKPGLRAFARSQVEVEVATEEALPDEYCGRSLGLLDNLLDPPWALQQFMSMTLPSTATEGIDDVPPFEIDTISAFGASQGSSVCERLGNLMGSSENFDATKAFVLLNDASELLTGPAADAERCARDSETCGQESAAVFSAEDLDPMCIGLRPCNDDDAIDGSVKFGFTTDANEGRGLDFDIGSSRVSFNGLAFDSAGGFPFTFRSPLMNPAGGERITSPAGAQFLITGGSLEIPLSKAGTSIGRIGITGAQIGVYSDRQANGEHTSDIVNVLGNLDSLEGLARGVDALQFQLFFDAPAEIDLNLGAFTSLPNSESTRFSGEISAMLDIQVETEAHRLDRRQWYLGNAGQTCSQVCNLYNFQCTDKSIEEQSSLSLDEAHAAFSEAGMECSGVTDASVGAPFDSPGGCLKPMPNSEAEFTCDTIGEQDQRPLCYCEDEGTGEVAVTESTQTKTVAQCVHEEQTFVGNTYISLSASTEISISDVSAILSGFNSFGEWIVGLLPEEAGISENPLDNAIQNIDGLEARTYLKLPLNGATHFVMQIDATIQVNCDFIDGIKDSISFMWEHIPGAAVIDAFCATEEPTLDATISVGFEGMSVDETNTYLEFDVGGDTYRIEASMFPSCPPPVITGGSCNSNSDCASSDSDEEGSCSAYQGYCLNNPTWHTSIGCLGTCVDLLPDGADCSGGALNLNALDLDRYTGDDDICQSGRCDRSTLLCAAALPNDARCAEDEDCASGRCASTFPWSCQDKLADDFRCWEDEDCQSNNCATSWRGRFCRPETSQGTELPWYPVLE